MSCIRPTIQYTRCSRMKRHEQKNDIQREETYDDESFKPNKPISLPSLENPPDVGPLYNTCRSVTGMEQQDANDDKDAKDEDVEFDRSFFGLQPRSNDLIGGNSINEDDVPLLMETGLGIFTSSVILGGSIYFILAVFFDDGKGVDPTMIPLSF